MSRPTRVAANERLRRVGGLRMAEAGKFGAMVAVLVVGAFLIGGTSQAMNSFCIRTLIDVLIVAGLYVFIGNSGIMSWGHISFMAIAAYGTGLLTTPLGAKRFMLPNLPRWLALLHMGGVEAAIVVILLVSLVAGVAGIPLMRLKGLSAAIATFCLLIVVNTVISQTPSITGGEAALVGVPITTTLGLCIACVVGSLCAIKLFDMSKIGLRLRASRDDRPAAEAVGINVTLERTLAFMLSAAIVALAGVLDSHYVGAFTPNDFYFDLTFITIAMLVVGGMRSLGGAVFGALLIGAIEQVLTSLQDHQSVLFIRVNLPDGASEMVVALVMIVVLIFAPDGLLAAVQHARPARLRRGVSQFGFPSGREGSGPSPHGIQDATTAEGSANPFSGK